MIDSSIVSTRTLRSVFDADADCDRRLALVADVWRLNALAARVVGLVGG